MYKINVDKFNSNEKAVKVILQSISYEFVRSIKK